MRRLSIPLALSLLVMAGGCVDSGKKYPSLLPRPIESQSLAEPDAPAPTPIAADPALDGRIAEITAKLDTAERAFNAAADKAEALVAGARGLPEGSEGWLNAQVALSDAEAKREPISAARADLEQLSIERGAAGGSPYPALDAAQAHAAALETAQEARIASLDKALKAD